MVNCLLRNKKLMKKSYIQPETIVMVCALPSLPLLAGSIGANDQVDPTMSPLLDEDLEQYFQYDDDLDRFFQ